MGSSAVRDVRGPDEDHGDRGGRELVVSRLLYQRAEDAEVSYTPSQIMVVEALRAPR